MIEIGPGNADEHCTGISMPPDSPETMLNSLFATTDPTVKNGATRAIPGSHKWLYSRD